MHICGMTMYVRGRAVLAWEVGVTIIGVIKRLKMATALEMDSIVTVNPADNSTTK